MNRFEELQGAYTAFKDGAHQYYMDSRFFIKGFAKKFQEYLGAPEFYEDFVEFGAPKNKRKYVSVAEATRDQNGELEYEEMPLNQAMPDLISDADGRWICGIQLVVDRRINNYPKSAYLYPVNFHIVNGECSMRIGGETGREFVFKTDDENGPNAAFDYMIGWLHEVYSAKPGDVRRTEPMGFIVHGKG